GRARYAHFGETQQTENQDGVEYDVQYGTYELRYHGKRGAARGLEYALIGYLYKHTEGEDEHYAQVRDAVGDYLRRVLRGHFAAYLRAHKRLCEEQTENQEYDIASGLKHHSAYRYPACVSRVLLSQRAAHQRVYAHAETYGKGDEQVLHRERQRDRSTRVLTYHRHKNTVLDVI